MGKEMGGGGGGGGLADPLIIPNAHIHHDIVLSYCYLYVSAPGKKLAQNGCQLEYASETFSKSLFPKTSGKHAPDPTCSNIYIDRE